MMVIFWPIFFTVVVGFGVREFVNGDTQSRKRMVLGLLGVFCLFLVIVTLKASLLTGDVGLQNFAASQASHQPLEPNISNSSVAAGQTAYQLLEPVTLEKFKKLALEDLSWISFVVSVATASIGLCLWLVFFWFKLVSQTMFWEGGLARRQATVQAVKASMPALVGLILVTGLVSMPYFLI